MVVQLEKREALKEEAKKLEKKKKQATVNYKNNKSTPSSRKSTRKIKDSDRHRRHHSGVVERTFTRCNPFFKISILNRFRKEVTKALFI